MGNLEHLQRVRDGGDRRNLPPGVRLDLSGFPLMGMDLSKRDLSGSNFADANLTEATLDGSCLIEADLTAAQLSESSLLYADLRRAICIRTNLGKAKLAGADLRATDLTNADLTESEALRAFQLGGAVLVNTKLPDNIQRFEGLDRVRELSRAGATTLWPLLLACAYVWLTLGTTTDAMLLLNSSSSELPVLKASLPILLFFYAAPILLLVFHICLGLYLQRLWEALTALPAIFPDGTRLDERIDPWLVNGLVHRRFERLRAESPAFGLLQSLLSLLLAYWVVPFTLAAVWLGCASRRDLWLTGFQILLLAVATGFAWQFQSLGEDTLRCRRPLLPTTSTAVEEGIQYAISSLWRRRSGLNAALAVAAVAALAVLADRQFPKLHMFSPDLAKIDLNNTNLSNADLRGANLRAAHFRGTELKGATLTGADLYEADLRGARNISSEQIRAALHWRSALLPDQLLEELGRKGQSQP
jgi:uncharacterized protein YjbI with pentapeptide repeats